MTTSADLSITKTGEAIARPGDQISYVLTVTNNGPATAQAVSVNDSPGVGLTFVTTFVSADGGGLEAAGTVTWSLGTLADGASATLHVTVHVDPARTTDISNTASVARATPVHSRQAGARCIAEGSPATRLRPLSMALTRSFRS